MIPGCWIAPYLMHGEVARKNGHELFKNANAKGGANEVLKVGPVDITKPGTQEFYLKQIRALRDAGFEDSDIFDICDTAAFFNYTNRIAHALDMMPNPDYHAMDR